MKEDETKGVGLVANRDISEGETVAYYQMRVVNNHPFSEKPTERGSQHRNKYTLSLLHADDTMVDDLWGDLSPQSFPPPEKVYHRRTKMRWYVPYWGYFANEPSEASKWNVTIHADHRHNFWKNAKKKKTKTSLKHKDIVRYSLVALEPIPEGAEILWCYGLEYERYIDVTDPGKGMYITECADKWSYKKEKLVAAVKSSYKKKPQKHMALI